MRGSPLQVYHSILLIGQGQPPNQRFAQLLDHGLAWRDRVLSRRRPGLTSAIRRARMKGASSAPQTRPRRLWPAHGSSVQILSTAIERAPCRPSYRACAGRPPVDCPKEAGTSIIGANCSFPCTAHLWQLLADDGIAVSTCRQLPHAVLFPQAALVYRLDKAYPPGHPMRPALTDPVFPPDDTRRPRSSSPIYGMGPIPFLVGLGKVLTPTTPVAWVAPCRPTEIDPINRKAARPPFSHLGSCPRMLWRALEPGLPIARDTKRPGIGSLDHRSPSRILRPP